MTTAAKLFGAIFFAVLVWIVAGLVKQVVSGASAATWFAPLTTLIGALMGWRVMGARAGEGFVAAIGYGLTTIFAVTFWSLLLWGSYEMIVRATRLRYDSPTEAVQDLMAIMITYSSDIVTPGIIGTMVIGSVVCGLMTEAISRRWS